MSIRFTQAGRVSALLRSGVAVAALLAATPALAADEVAAGDGAEAAAEADYADSGEAIIVTARRREESSQDVPIALSVVSAATLEQTGNFTLNQVQQLVPSLQVVSTNPRNSNINIRGLGSNSSIAVDGLEYGVGFYVDGVYYGRPGQSQFDLVDLAQVEVLRGPQGTLFGKNTTAGALNITTREPSFDPELTVEGSIGDYKYHQIRASGSLPIIDDKVALRVSVADTHRDGFLTNIYTGEDAQDWDNFTARAQLLIKPSETVKIRLIGDYSKQRQKTILIQIDDYFTTYANGAAIPNDIFTRAARNNYTLPTGNAFQRIGSADAPYQVKMESYGVSGQLDWDLGFATLTSITAHRWWDWFPRNDVDATSLSINTKGHIDNFQRQFSQELRLASNGDNAINYVAGLFYFKQSLRGHSQLGYGKDFAEWNLNPAAVPAATIRLIDLAMTDTQTNSWSNPRTKSYAAFGQADWRISPALTFTAGLRYTHEDKDGYFRREFDTASGLDLVALGLSAAELAAIQGIRNTAAYQLNNVAFDAKLKSDALSGLATVSYKLSSDVLAYASYSRGSKSGGINVTAGGFGRAIVRPEKVNAYEIGLKTQFLNKRATFNLAAFLTDIKDYQSPIQEQVPGTTQSIQYLANIPKVRSKGVEADLAYAPSRWLNLSASAAYTDAKYIDFTNAPQAPENGNLPAPQNSIQDLSGVRLPGVSKFAYSLAADVAQPVSQDLEIYARGDWFYRSSFNSTSTNSIYGTIPGYGVLNARLGLRTADGGIDLAIWARNLLDKNYYLTRSPGTFGLITAASGDPRTIGGTLRIKW